MIYLRGTRVLLIDDDLSESIPVIKAFAKKGIPVAYFDGSIEDLPNPNEKFSDIRLAILDMDLVGGGDNDVNKISTLIARLQAIISSENGPYTMIAWTKHSDLVNLLENRLFTLFRNETEQDKVPFPVVCITLEKKDFKTNSEFDIEKLFTNIEEELGKYTPLNIMQSWEERNFRATCGVTNSISKMINTNNESLDTWKESWKKEYLGLLNNLAGGEIGKDNLTKETFLPSLFGALNPLQFDFFESDHCQTLVLTDEIITDSDVRNNPLAGKINSKLHISFEDLDIFKPGNIYKLNDISEIINVNNGSILEELLDKAEYKTEVEENVVPIFLEVSALCDFAQKKLRLTKLLAGFISPITLLKKFKQKGDFFKYIKPIWFENQERLIILNSHYFFTLHLDDVKKIKAYARLRNQYLVFIQSWLSHQFSRIGILILE